MKALLDARTNRILGFTMIGPEAGEVMAVVQTAMLAGLPYTGLRDAILAAPDDGGRSERGSFHNCRLRPPTDTSRATRNGTSSTARPLTTADSLHIHLI